MRFFRSCSILLMTGVLSASLLACAADRREAKEEFNRITDVTDRSFEQIRPKREVSPLTVDDTPWLGAQAVPVSGGELLPQKFEDDKALVLTFEQPLTFDQVAARIQSATGVRVIADKASAPTGAQPGAAPQSAGSGGGTFMPVDGMEVTGGRTVWQGKLSSLLDQVADQFDAEWRYSDNTIHISQQIVRTFMLHALAGSTDVGGSVKTGSTGAEGGLPQQSVDSTSKLALWDEIQKSIDTIITGRARASYSPATGTITLAGSPTAIKAAEDYLRLQNKLRLRRVGIEAKVLSVRLAKEYDHNLDIDVVIADAFNSQSIVFSTARGATGGRGVTAGVVRDIPSNLGTQDTVQAVISALSAVSEKIGVEYSGNLVTLSDQPAPLQVATKQSYVARVSGSSSDTTSSLSLEPGTIDIGLSMNLLPRVIEEDRIMLRVALGLTDLVSLERFDAGQSSIQLPTVDTTGFLQNAVLRSGETLVLAGFEKKNASYNRNGVGSPNFFGLGGGETFAKGREIRVLLITATVLPEEPVSVVQP